MFLKYGIAEILSEQNLIDCTVNYGSKGCNGGSVLEAYEYFRDYKFLELEENYPYEEKINKCQYDTNKQLLKINFLNPSFVYLKPKFEKTLKIAVATAGPIASAIDASHDSFKFYSKGIFLGISSIFLIINAFV